MSTNSLLDRYIREVDNYIVKLKSDYDRAYQTYENCKFLRENYDIHLPAYEGISTIGAEKTFEILNFFGEVKEYSLADIESALYMCGAGEKNPKFKTQARYKSSIVLLEKIKVQLRGHLFRKVDSNKYSLDDKLQLIDRYTNISKFLKGEITEIDLDTLESYEFSFANFSLDEWVELYTILLKMYMESLIKIEDKLKDDKKEQLADVIDSMAIAVEEKMLGELSPESVEILLNDGVLLSQEDDVVDSYAEQFGEPVAPQGVSSKKEHLVSITDERVISLYKKLRDKARQYKRYGKVDSNKLELFASLKGGLGTLNTLENTKAAFIPSDYLKFLYFCFVNTFSGVVESLEDQYEMEEIDEFVELILDILQNAEVFLNELEKEVSLQETLTQQEQSYLDTITEEHVVANKLIFYERNGKSEIEKCMKDYSPEKISDLAVLVKKIEDGTLDGMKTVKKETSLVFKLLCGRYVFVVFRPVTNNHTIVYLSSNLADLNKSSINARFESYVPEIEDDIIEMIRDGEDSLEYRKLMKRSEAIKSTLLRQGLVKGV